MAYKVTEIRPNYNDRVMDVVITLDDQTQLTFTVKSRAELVEALQRHEQFMSDVKDMRTLVEAEVRTQ